MVLYKNGKREGKYISYHQNGEIKRKSHFKDGKKEGEDISYYQNGKIKSKSHFKDGKKLDS